MHLQKNGSGTRRNPVRPPGQQQRHNVPHRAAGSRHSCAPASPLPAANTIETTLSKETAGQQVKRNLLCFHLILGFCRKNNSISSRGFQYKRGYRSNVPENSAPIPLVQFLHLIPSILRQTPEPLSSPLSCITRRRIQNGLPSGSCRSAEFPECGYLQRNLFRSGTAGNRPSPHTGFRCNPVKNICFNKRGKLL